VTAQSVNLPENKQKTLRRLFDSEGFEVLIEVLESRAFELEIEIANKSLKGTTGYDNEAKESVRQAQVAKGAIALLKDIQSLKVFTVSTAKPTTPNDVQPTK